MKRVTLVVAIAVALLGVQASSAAPLAGDSDELTVDGNTGPLLLQAGDVAGISAEADDLLLDTATGSAAGVAPDARYTYGDPAAPTDRPAFTLTNADGDTHRLTIAYSGTDDEDTDANVQFRVHDADGHRLVTASEESGTVAVDLDGNERVYVVVVIDTHGLSTTTDLSGSLDLTLA